MRASCIIRYESAGRLDVSNRSNVAGQKSNDGIEWHIREDQAKMEMFMEG